ncbi:DUF4391 domain-containing protein [Segetibacter koreensis]|uniref:DUF4391 domain-containing protein n=1 Tax=Segetibacter koreensis TaxID=398037 RepID=UPI00035E42DB|nr:DUF4391 domain-containing protein [Segetibacter koreensis]
MNYFNLPASTIVNRFVPKNAFDEFINSKQKKKFADVIDKITWLNKLSKETINLTGNETSEVQIFEVRLKEAVYPKDLLDIIDKAIPYQIVFVLSYKEVALISTSKKHHHPLNEDKAVVDWSFSTTWFNSSDNNYQFNLKISIDFVYADFCSQLSNYAREQKDLSDLIEYDKKIKELKTRISAMQSAIKNEKQFNRKVELNLQLNQARRKLSELLNLDTNDLTVQGSIS